MAIYTKSLSKDQQSKVLSDLNFLSKIIKISKKKQYRIVVTGGYGLDGLLGKITRPHNDLDLVIYWQKDRAKATDDLKSIILKIYPQAQILIKPEIFYTEIDVNNKGFGGNIYLVETVNNPFKDLNTIKLKSGKVQVNSDERFPASVNGKLNNIEFEVQNPNLHLADIIFKRKRDKKIHKHDQDIKNLKLITKKDAVKSILTKY